MKTRLLPTSLLAIASAAALATATAQDAGAWTTLFGPDTKNLDDWVIKSGFATYEIKDGTILGTTAKGSGNTFLCSKKLYGDFELTFEVKCDSHLNSGVQIRSTLNMEKVPEHGGRINGPQVEIEASGEKGAESGYIYGEAAGGWLSPDRPPHKHFKDGEWNTYKIVAKGPRIQTWINGEAIEDLTHEAIYKTHPKGHIGLQVHGIGKEAGPMTVQWRNIKIRDLAAGDKVGGAKLPPVKDKMRRLAKENANQNNSPFAMAVPGKPGHVFSPFAPDKEVDVAGFPRGTEVRCPYSQKVFRTP